METEYDFVSALLAIGDGGVEFFASCLLHLDPGELKSCRLVNSAWDEFIRKEVWGRRRRRLLLKEKLVERWKNIDPATEEFGHVRMTLGPDLAADGVRKVDSIFCNNSHVFCGLPCGKVGVFCLTTGEWVRDLMPGKIKLIRGYYPTKVAGSDIVVAAVMWNAIVVVWSSKKEMERLFCLDVINKPCFDVSCEHFEDGEVEEVKVVGDKVVVLLQEGWHWKTSLVVIHKGGQNVWESKTLACIQGYVYALLATEENWIAVAGRARTRSNTVEIKLWEGENFRQDICVHDYQSAHFWDIALKLPFIVVSCGDMREDSCVKVYQLASDNLMEDIKPVATLIKTIQLGGKAQQLIFNELFFGFVLHPGEDDTQAVVLIEKKALLDASIPSDKTAKRQILLHKNGSPYTVGINTTGLVFATWLKKDKDDDLGSHDDHENVDSSDEDLEEEKVVIPLHKKDFWKTYSIN